MGGTHELAIINLIKTGTPMPVTQRYLNEAHPDTCLTRAHLHTHLGLGWVIEDDGKFWVSDEIMAQSETEAQKNLDYWTKRLEYIKSQRKALASRNMTVTSS